MADWQGVATILMTERYARLVARARMLAPSTSEAEDLVQDALIATFSKPRDFESVAAAEQYVRRAIITTHLNAVNRGGKEKVRWLRVVGSGTASDHAPRTDGKLDVDAALAVLPPRVRACIALRYLEDMSIAETAHHLGLTDGAVKRYVSDGLKALNETYGLAVTADDSPRVRVSEQGGSR